MRRQIGSDRLRSAQIGSDRFERAARDADAVDGSQPGPDIAASAPPGEEIAIGADDPVDGLHRLVEELDAEVGDATGEEHRHHLSAALGHGMEEGVAAADVGRERVFDANPITELDDMVVAGTAAVGLVGAGRENGAEDTVLHVEQGHPLMDHRLEHRRWHRRHELGKLIAVEIVGGDDPASAVGPEERRREAIGDVEGEVGVDRSALGVEEVQGGEVPHEHSVRLLLVHQLEDAVLSRLVDPRSGRADRAPGEPDELDSVAVAANVGEVGIDVADPRGQRPLDLLEGSAEEMKDRIASGRGGFHLAPHRLIGPGNRLDCPGTDRPGRDANHLGRELLDKLTTELADDAQGEHRGPDDPGVEGAQFEGGAAESAELIARKGAGLLRLPDERKPFTVHIDEVAFMTAVDEALLALVKRFYLQRDGAAVEGVASLDKDRERVDSILAWLETQIDKGSWRGRGGFGRAELWAVTALDWMRFREAHPLDKCPKLVALLEQANGRPTLHATRPGQAEA